MRKLPIKILLFFTLLLLISVSNSYAQDALPPKEGTIKVEASESIKQLIAKKRSYNKNKKYTQGFKIQLFYGSEQAAIKIKDKFKSVFFDVEAMLDFDSPYWKVIVGNYKKRLEADRALIEVKDGFPSAIVVPAKVKI